MSSEAQLREQIALYGRMLYQRGLSFGSTGNISARLDDGWLLTPTNSCLGLLDPARISKLDDDDNHVAGDKPSKEAFLHRGMYDVRPAARAVVHLHSPNAVAISCLDGLNPEDVLPPITPYPVMKVGRLKLIAYYRPGDAALGDAVRAVAAEHKAVLLANHGPVVSGKSLEDAVYTSEEIEEASRLTLMLHGRPVRALTDAEIQDLERAFGPA